MSSHDVESRFIGWLATRPDLVAALSTALPQGLLSSSGQRLLHSLNGHTKETFADPLEPEEAVQFLQSQLLAYLGKEAGKAQKTGSLARVSSASLLLNDCLTLLEPLPVSDYKEIEPQYREVIPTGIRSLDAQIRGLGRGELGIVAFPPGRGKTATLINFTVSALHENRSVLYITVADQGLDELVPRIDTCILEEPQPFEVPHPIVVARHQQATQRVTGNLEIADFTDRECSLREIENTIKTQKVVDLVLVDHADDVVSPYSVDPNVTRHSLRTVYMTLKKLAVKHNVPIWTASQTSEQSWWLDSASINDLAEAKVGKASGASIVLVFSTGRGEFRRQGVVYATIAKARRAYTQRTVPINIDHARCQLW